MSCHGHQVVPGQRRHLRPEHVGLFAASEHAAQGRAARVKVGALRKAFFSVKALAAQPRVGKSKRLHIGLPKRTHCRVIVVEAHRFSQKVYDPRRLPHCRVRQ